MRGKVFGKLANIGDDRITPAYAGKSQQSGSGYNDRWDHPRLCGEKQLHKLFKLHLSGSPPPMRGKVSDDLRRNLRIGITPAYAGKSVFELCVRGFDRDHPRLCGEKLPIIIG